MAGTCREREGNRPENKYVSGWYICTERLWVDSSFALKWLFLNVGFWMILIFFIIFTVGKLEKTFKC